MADEADQPTPIWLHAIRVTGFIACLLAMAYRTELLQTAGYQDDGWPRWIFAAIGTVMAVAFAMIPGEHFYPSFIRTSLARVAYLSAGLLLVVPVLFAVFADLPYFDGLVPLFLIAVIALPLVARKVAERNAAS